MTWLCCGSRGEAAIQSLWCRRLQAFLSEACDDCSTHTSQVGATAESGLEFRALLVDSCLRAYAAVHMTSTGVAPEEAASRRW